jgi:hypothetical protein
MDCDKTVKIGELDKVASALTPKSAMRNCRGLLGDNEN